MELNVCHGCRKQLLNKDEYKNIFNEDSIIKSSDNDDDEKWSLTLISGIELIIGQKIKQEDNFPKNLCNSCFQSIEAFLNFKHQLLKSRKIFSNANNKNESDSLLDNEKSMDLKSSLNAPVEDVVNKEMLKETVADEDDDEEETFYGDEFPTLESSCSTHNQLEKISTEDLINVDESSNASFEINNLHKKVLDSKYDHEIESEIDVVSGEEDDILELDIEKAKNETVEINSSSESDIEVCDYEPACKKINYSALSPSIEF